MVVEVEVSLLETLCMGLLPDGKSYDILLFSENDD